MCDDVKKYISSICIFKMLTSGLQDWKNLITFEYIQTKTKVNRPDQREINIQ